MTNQKYFNICITSRHNERTDVLDITHVYEVVVDTHRRISYTTTSGMRNYHVLAANEHAYVEQIE